MDNEQLVNAITAIIMERMGAEASSEPAASASGAQVVCFGDVPDGLVGPGFASRVGRGAGDTDGAEYIVLTAAAFRAFHGGAIPAGLAGVQIAPPAPAPAPTSCCGAATAFDLSAKKLVSERDVRGLKLVAGSVIKVCPNAIVTSLAKDFAHSVGAEIVC